MIISRRRLAVVAAAALLLAGCGEPSAGGSGGSAPPNSFVLYSGRSEELIGPLVKQFTEETGIEVEARYGSTTEMAAQLMEEGNRSPAQVFLSQDAGALGAVADAGLLSTLPAEVTGKVDPRYTSTDGSWVGLTGRARVIVYDSQELRSNQVPDEVGPLIEPEWKGRVGIAPTNASFQAFVTALRLTEGEAAAEQWLTALKANAVQTYEGNGDILEAVNTGALDVGLVNHYYWFEAAAEQGADRLRAQMKFGKPGSASALVNVTGAGILRGQEQNAAAQRFVAWLVGEQAQRYFVTETYEYSLIPGATGPEGAPALADLRGPDIDLSDLASLEQTVALLQKVGLV